VTTPIPLKLTPEERVLLDEMVRVVGTDAIGCAHPLVLVTDSELAEATSRARRAPQEVAQHLQLDERVERQQLDGIAWRPDGRRFDLPKIYGAEGRRIWPLVSAVTGDLLP